MTLAHTTTELPLHIDSTMMSCARSCLQKFEKEFIRGLRPPGISVDLHAGACFSTALETVYNCIFAQGMSLGDALDRARAAFFVAWGPFEIPEWKRTAKTPDRMWEAVEAYFERWPPHTDLVRPYMDTSGRPTVEYTFAIPLEPADGFPEHPSGAPFIYTGRFDMLGQTPEGTMMPKDDKTTGSSISYNWSEQWRLRSQFIGYVWALRQAGYQCSSVHVRGIAIQKTQFSFAEATPIYSDHTIERWHDQLRRDLWRIYRAHSDNHWDYNLGETCTHYGICPFMDACTSRDPEPWLSTFEVRRWNPLLKNPAPHPDPASARAA